MAILIGGQVFTSESGQTLASVSPDNLGHARHARLDMHSFSIIGGKGDIRQLHRHVASLKSIYPKIQDVEDRRHMLRRIGRLQGGSAVLYVGGITKLDIDESIKNAESTGAALRSAISTGYIPGGGAAYIACQARLKEAAGENDPLEKRAAYRILARALEEPTRTILTNSGLEIEDWLGPIRQGRGSVGVDVCTRKLGDMVAAGILDSAAVAKAVCQNAVSTAALALTLDVFIHQRKPPVSNEP
jgi:chaperonin GroEL